MQERFRDRMEEWVYKTFRVGDEVRFLGGFKESLQDGKRRGCLVNRNLPCSIDSQMRLSLIISL